MLLGMTNAVELTFELPDSAKECFFEIIQEGTESTVEYQVSQGPGKRNETFAIYFIVTKITRQFE